MKHYYLIGILVLLVGCNTNKICMSSEQFNNYMQDAAQRGGVSQKIMNEYFEEQECEINKLTINFTKEDSSGELMCCFPNERDCDKDCLYPVGVWIEEKKKVG